MRNILEWDSLKEGDVLIADKGFTCIPEGKEVVVKKDNLNCLCVPCDAGEHYLDGQLMLDGSEYIVGFKKKE